MATHQNTKPAKAIVKTTAKPAVKGAPSAKSGKRVAAAEPVRRPAAPAAAKTAAKAIPRFSDKDLDVFRKELLATRDRLTGQVARMRQDSLKRDDEVNPEEDGTDAFDRLFALERAGKGQDVIFIIDEAMRAIDEGKYGVCESCGNLIEKPRLHALPFAKNCIKCQSEAEHGRGGNGVHRRAAP